jgi:hypothetical protein
MRERGGVRMREVMDRIIFVALAVLIVTVMLAMPDAW